MRIIYLIALIILNAGMCYSDGFPIVDGQYTGGNTIFLEATKIQKKIINTSYTPFMIIEMSGNQIAQIKNSKGINQPPTKLLIVKIEDAVGECTCGLSNLGLILKDGRIQVPLQYIYSDEEADKRKIID